MCCDLLRARRCHGVSSVLNTPEGDSREKMTGRRGFDFGVCIRA